VEAHSHVPMQSERGNLRPSSLARLTPWVESRFGPRSEPESIRGGSQAIWNVDRSGVNEGTLKKEELSWDHVIAYPALSLQVFAYSNTWSESAGYGYAYFRSKIIMVRMEDASIIHGPLPPALLRQPLLQFSVIREFHNYYTILLHPHSELLSFPQH